MARMTWQERLKWDREEQNIRNRKEGWLNPLRGIGELRQKTNSTWVMANLLDWFRGSRSVELPSCCIILDHNRLCIDGVEVEYRKNPHYDGHLRLTSYLMFKELQ